VKEALTVVTRFRETTKWLTQYMMRQWEFSEYRGREYTDALYQKKGPAATITLNRPEKRNALNDKMFEDYLAGLHQANDDPEVKVVVIRGAGISFCAGHELSSPEGEESPPVHPSLKLTTRDFYNLERRRCSKHEHLFHYPKPTIAQVHGRCIGAGEAIAASCDFTIAAEDATFGVRGFSALPLGFSCYVGAWPAGSHITRAGHMRPERSGLDMAKIGAVTRAVPIDKLEEEVQKWIDVVLLLPADSLAIQKELINGIQDITGMGASWRTHYEGHIGLQWVKFRKDEVSFYKAKKDAGLKGFLDQRAEHTKG
jgi:enoyl-CoA hydratase